MTNDADKIKENTKKAEEIVSGALKKLAEIRKKKHGIVYGVSQNIDKEKIKKIRKKIGES